MRATLDAPPGTANVARPPHAPARRTPVAEPAARRGRIARWGAPLVAIAIASAAFWTLHRELEAYRYHDLMRLARALPAPTIALAIALTAVGYVAMLGYDVLALRFIGRTLSLRRTAFASFIAYSFSQTLGFSALTGASVRYRFWSAWGLSAEEIARGVVFTSATFWLGILSIAGVSCLTAAFVPETLPLPRPATLALGIAMTATVGAYLLWCARPRTLRVRGWTFHAPPPSVGALQVVISAADWMVAASVLWVLLPHAAGLGPLTFVAIFLVAQTSGLASHIPGGLGVFESVSVLLLERYLPAASIIAALVAYRAIYYVLPFTLATISLAGHEVVHRRERLSRLARAAGAWAPSVVPHLLGITTFVAGTILLVSGATPPVHSRMRWLADVFPLAVIEVSHFANSLLGAGLLLLALGLRRRLDAAYHLATVALAAGIVTSLLKGGDYEEALALSVVLATLLSSRRHFTRRAALIGSPFTPGWIVAVALVFAGTLALGLFSFKHVEYSNELWWRFTLRGDAPRFLRGIVGAAAATAMIGLAHLLRVAPLPRRRPTAGELGRASIILADAAEGNAHLALLGDKSLLFDAGERGFLMYGVEGRSWVALGDPVGPAEVRTELAWRFREMADRAGGWPVFYEASRENLPLYIDLGLTILKVGEMARVPLETFSLDGGARKGMRRVVKDVERDGCSFSIVERQDVAAMLPELRRVSDAWLASKRTREKGFSLGCFDESYLASFRQAIVRRDGEVVAFANLWEGARRSELSMDLMRYVPGAPSGVMEYLVIQLMLRGRADGYRWFDLGMAPLAGLENRALAPLWSRVGALVFSHGEHFYNFRGLRLYKDKFDPVWEPRYLASPGGIALPRILANIASLISGGLKGVVVK